MGCSVALAQEGGESRNCFRSRRDGPGLLESQAEMALGPRQLGVWRLGNARTQSSFTETALAFLRLTEPLPFVVVLASLLANS